MFILITASSFLLPFPNFGHVASLISMLFQSIQQSVATSEGLYSRLRYFAATCSISISISHRRCAEHSRCLLATSIPKCSEASTSLHAICPSMLISFSKGFSSRLLVCLLRPRLVLGPGAVLGAGAVMPASGTFCDTGVAKGLLSGVPSSYRLYRMLSASERSWLASSRGQERGGQERAVLVLCRLPLVLHKFCTTWYPVNALGMFDRFMNLRNNFFCISKSCCCEKNA